MTTWRVGQGFDAHPWADGRPLVLGGLEIPWHQGLEGDSDGDVLTHAIIDSVLGALAWGDLGHWFRPDDPTVRGARSTSLLSQVMARVTAEGVHLINLDSTVILERPRLSPHVEAMRTVLAPLLGMSSETLSIKATTTDGMGWTGRGEGVAAMAQVLLSRD